MSGAVLDLPRTFGELPSLDEDDCCHIVLGRPGDPNPRTVCGAPYDCRVASQRYSGQEVCPDCGRVLCPACVQGTGLRGTGL